MCDYSLQNAKSRPAAVGDKLVVINFGYGTQGFAEAATLTEDRYAATAICLLPGTEIAFDEPVAYIRTIVGAFHAGYHQSGHKVARFRQINLESKLKHHDAVEFPDGEVVLLTNLQVNQTATVLQLPAKPKNKVEADEQRRVEFAG